jgi:hypothetical protein
MSRFDLEQEIMKCWYIVDDIKMIYNNTEKFNLNNDMQNVLLGMISLYELKFDTLFQTFEKCIENKEI